MQLQEDKPYDSINITPMLDLAYVLLVIFIIMTTASVQGLKADLPHGSSAPTSNEPPKTKVISVGSTGQLFFDGTPVSIGDLESRLRAALAAVPDLPVIVKGDRAVQYERVMTVIDLCGRVGVKSIGLASQHITGS